MTRIVKIENLSKRYFIYHENRGTYVTLVETLTKKIQHGLRYFTRSISKKPLPPRRSCEELWALKDINLAIEEGDRVGIMGRNGAGKSTLLKVLSRITQPTTGKISIKGRVSSLLEVGTGFHPELTGKENIFLNGAILGMPYQEIKRKFDEIVAFAEVEKFLDSPVKQYSSGMYTRLGFAIAASLDPDLLIVDEALAVGDLKFQEKCLKKLNDLSAYGRTVLFVSHDINSVLALCNKGLYLEKGILKEYGPITDCLKTYLQSLSLHTLSWEGEEGDEHIRFHKVNLKGAQEHREYFFQQDKIYVAIDYVILKYVPNLILGIGVWNPRNQLLANAYTLISSLGIGKRQTLLEIDAHLFHEGEYVVKIDCSLQNKKKIISDQITLKLVIYPHQTQPNLIKNPFKEGIYLGNRWEHKSLCLK
jgi:lipopolysaccharide transport system ATP-binding protein